LIGRIFDSEIVQSDMLHWPFKVIKGANGQPKIKVGRRRRESARGRERRREQGRERGRERLRPFEYRVRQ
jgi:hypothetical protein